MPKTLQTVAVLALISVLGFVVEQGFVLWEFLFFDQKFDGGVKNFWELTYYITNSTLVVVASGALLVAWWQSAEARRNRLATVYLEITKRWSDADLKTSRKLLFELKSFYDRNAATLPQFGSAAEYVADFLLHLRRTNPERHSEYVQLLTFLEDLGVLCRQGHIHEHVVLDFICGGIVHYVELTMLHIKLRRRNDRVDGTPSLSTYANLIWLYRRAKRHSRGAVYSERDDDLPLLR